MNKKELLVFHDEQMEQIFKNRSFLSMQGYVKGYRDVYPDVYQRIQSKKGISYIRGSVSVKLMCILYDAVILHIPPISKQQLEKRFYLSWDELISLCQQGLVIPIIGKAEHYTGKHFDDLFTKLPVKPYSLWARGLGLLEVFGMSNTLEIAKNIMPIDAMTSDPSVYNKWSKEYRGYSEEYIKRRIQDDIAIQYADLCIFGCKSEAESLLSLSPSDLYDSLKLLNEIRTYPVLFGLESQANYDQRKLRSVSTIPVSIRKDFYFPQIFPKDEIEILYNGIGIDVDNVSVKNIIDYRNDGLGIKLRAALSHFNNYCEQKISSSEKMDLSEVYNRANLLQKELRQAISDLTGNDYYNKLDTQADITTKTLKVGAVVAGAAVAFNPEANQAISAIALASGVLPSIIGTFPESISEILIRLKTKGFNSKFIANMWSAKRIVGGR